MEESVDEICPRSIGGAYQSLCAESQHRRHVELPAFTHTHANKADIPCRGELPRCANEASRNCERAHTSFGGMSA